MEITLNPVDMLKYTDTQIVFREVPDEVTLAINISNCPMLCPGCHSPYLAKDIGNPITKAALDQLIQHNSGITCVCFMGGDLLPHEVNGFAKYIRRAHPELKIAWYSGAPFLSKAIRLENFDFIKIGPYHSSRGGLDSPDTNQKFYEVVEGKYMNDITSIFWKRD